MNPNELIHPISSRETPDEIRPLGLLRTPILELGGFIGMGIEGRSTRK